MNTFCKSVEKTNVAPFELKLITNRGVRVWPGGMKETFCVDHWRARFIHDNCTQANIVDLLSKLSSFDIIKTENLYSFDGKPIFSHQN